MPKTRDESSRSSGTDDFEVESFLGTFSPRRGLDIIYGEGSLVQPHQKREQSDISVTTRSSKVEDYGMSSRTMHMISQRSGLATLPTHSESMTSNLGYWFEDNPLSRPAGEMSAELANMPSDGSDTDEDSMESLLHSATQPAKHGAGGKEWLPVSALDSICKPPIVYRELKTTCSAADAEIYTDYICGDAKSPPTETQSARRIFCILVLIGKVARFPDFVKAGLKDKHLPFLWMDNESRKYLYSPSSKYKLQPLPCFKKKDVAVMKPFYQWQWQMLVPFIARDSDDEVKEYQLHRDTIMPWTEFASRERESGFSQVRRVEIHGAHHIFHKHKSFALKTLHQNNPVLAAEEFRSELHVFMKMKPEKHLLELCATFKSENEEVDHEYSFLFPWADGGSLEKLWSKQPRGMLPNRNITPTLFLKWIAEQCHGLAAALRNIHDVRMQALKRSKLDDRRNKEKEEDEEYYGIHGDIKPENILHFSQLESESPYGLGILKIADFGLTEFHTFRSRTRKAIDWQLPTPAPTYRAPELVVPGEYFSRKADVWSLGCVFSQFITWAVLGVESVHDFDRLRKEERDYDHKKRAKRFKSDAFFKAEYISDNKVKTSLKDQTTKWLDNLYPQVQNGQEGNFVTEFLDIIKNEMLENNREKRIGCQDIVERLAKFVTKSGTGSPDDPYWNPPLPSFASNASTASNMRAPKIKIDDMYVSDEQSIKSDRKASPKVAFQVVEQGRE